MIEIWFMVWLTCTGGRCWPERIEQEFLSEQTCQFALDFYRRRDGVIGACTKEPKQS